jgi:uncharacterized cupin superfamily protein
MDANAIWTVEGDRERRTPGPQRAGSAVEGAPIESSHEYHAKDGRTVGVWVCSPGRMLGEEHPHDESCTIISGKGRLIDNDGGGEQTFVVGDSFFFPKGGNLTWFPTRRFGCSP